MITMETIYESNALEVIKCANEERAIFTLHDKLTGDSINVEGFDLMTLAQELIEESEEE